MSTAHIHPTHHLAIIGYGTQGVYHTRNLRALQDVAIEVVGVYDTDPRAHEDARADGLHVYSSHQDLLADPSIDVVFICTPNDSHYDYAAALRAGKHVLCEKPATMSSQEMRSIKAIAEETGHMFMVHQNRRWDPDFNVIKTIYNDQLIDEPTYLEQRIHGSRGIPGDWRQKPEHGGGMVLDWGVHTVDRLLTMVGSPVADVYGELSFALGHEVDDGFRARLTFANGFKAMVDVSTTSFLPEAKFWMQSASGSVVIEDREMNGRIVRRTGAEEEDATPVQAGVGLTKTMAPRILDYAKMASTTPPVEVLPLPHIATDVMDFYRNARDIMDGAAEPVITNDSVIRCLTVLEAVIESARTHEIVHPER
ncbi:Gfo/Idh/MocA family oxidoreductase [Actinomyces urogenitalis]|jgi:predicted dehydrogenase|uniref:Gfo/Idh/MocA family oxidoreductase n=1 Tax=Actinomyces urogenitalis TaxID=103621 RepID=UPI0024302747|nr:Gfo/Idh/MocA family oxidoreductase [Actinomyces urogenitalis]MBS5977381.1 Gfo/Idh/MocA family oxidoreductase [Actinomyces urogenitalis]MDU0863596.1 Gfo/Idh/MocA family oxidoreductase [Actinomyces urogenitalis]MDU0874059.1 Gfo/Idh/MocA family oxidoreductase [Actinomyces urogenitalis]MDU1563761.1 Gfo/Idh/MocA family oxidoreductase [Actinomyces urogenitalis]MDU1639128.1 Gfo/Idh/MocA family oxidoreductase [Actinomyces urogenitalis]